MATFGKLNPGTAASVCAVIHVAGRVRIIDPKPKKDAPAATIVAFSFCMVPVPLGTSDADLPAHIRANFDYSKTFYGKNYKDERAYWRQKIAAGLVQLVDFEVVQRLGIGN
jgi:hypothetical protein